MNNEKQVICPITLSNNVELIKTFKVKKIINDYKYKLGIEVSDYFNNNNQIHLYKCRDTGLEFFHPFVVGDGKFYSKLQKFDYYYMKTKVEYDWVLKYILGSNIKNGLEIGCGDGYFLQILRTHNINVQGLDINEDAVNTCINKGLEVHFGEILQFARDKENIFDFVCSFQVMEHIVNPRETILASIKLLKRGGKLIIAVPNNSSFIKDDTSNLLNFPPHHNLRWYPQTFPKLEQYFPMKFVEAFNEPLAKMHYDSYAAYKLSFLAKYFGLGGRIVRRILIKPCSYYIEFTKGINRMGHTTIAVFEKTN